MSGWISACRPPSTSTRAPPICTAVPGSTISGSTSIFMAPSCPAVPLSTTSRACGFAFSRAGRRSGSRWSGCWCVTSTASMPVSPSKSAEKLPGSISSRAAPVSSSTHECPKWVTSMGPLFHHRRLDVVARVVVDVMPKPEILDPQGQAVAGALHRLGVAGVTDVRQGKHCELEVDDAVRAVRLAGGEAVNLWHADRDLHGVDAVVVPGGFSYGDYLRAGAIAARAPIMDEVVVAADHGMPVLGICNGFQILCEAGLLPGALIRNVGLHFVCRDLRLRVESASTAWTGAFAAGQEIVVPLKSGEGRYVADAATLAQLEADGRIVFRYVDPAPNGSTSDIAGIASANGRVVGLMPHPEHAIEPLTGPSADGLGLFTSVLA